MEHDAKNWLKVTSERKLHRANYNPEKMGVFPEIHRSWGLGEEMLFKLLKIPQKISLWWPPKKLTKHAFPDLTKPKPPDSGDVAGKPVCHGDVPRW